MDAADDLAIFYQHFGEAVTVRGIARTCIFDGGYVDVLGVAATQPTLRSMAADAIADEAGDAVVRKGTTYAIRDIQPIAPDELEVRLILERQ